MKVQTMDKKRIILLMKSAGISEEQFQSIRKNMSQENRKIVRFFSLLSGVLFVCMLTVTLIVPSLRGNVSIYIGGAVSSILIQMVERMNRNDLRIANLNMYAFAVMLLLVGVALGTYLGPHEVSATFIAFLLTIPQLFTDRPYRMVMVVFSSVVLFIAIAFIAKDPATWSSDFTNAIVFGILSMVLCSYSISTRVSRLYLEELNRQLATSDQLTGLKNRYSYEQTLGRIASLEVKDVFCVYVDVNGLHEMNDTYGHEAGDRMLRKVADAMRDQFGEENSYRIGGDEFVAVGAGITPDLVKENVAGMKKAVEAEGYHVAAGISCRENGGCDVSQFIKEAEQEMYRDKSSWYRSSGVDRRRR